jgi:hypothetical protein
MKGIATKLIGNKAYVSKTLFDDLFQQGTTLITKGRNKRKNILMNLADKIMLKKRSWGEIIFSSLKSFNTLLHSCHRSLLKSMLASIAWQGLFITN